jgi:hypothetical protein
MLIGLDPTQEHHMPNPKNNTKMTGDTHLPEIESSQPVEEASPIGLGTRGMQSGLVGHAVKKAGVITDGEERADAEERSDDSPGKTSGKSGA